MKKSLFLFTCFSLLVCASPGWTYFVGTEDVGDVDSLMNQTFLSDSGYGSELAWIQGTLGGDYTFADGTNTPGAWTSVNGEDDIHALELIDEPEYFFVKIGTGDIDLTNDHFLYSNGPSYSWAVIDWEDVFGEGNVPNNFDVTRISHIQEISAAPVPEPATMLLLGSGLIGLGAAGRKKIKT